jgi:hypothetical protein
MHQSVLRPDFEVLNNEKHHFEGRMFIALHSAKSGRAA